MQKAIFIDIDGTLINDDNNTTQRTIDIIKKIGSKSVYIVLCTGRPRDYAEKVSKECGASKYIITSSGAEVYDYEEKKVIYSNKMSVDACEQLYELAEKNDARFIMNVGNTRVVNKIKHNDGTETLLTENIKGFAYKNEILQCVISSPDYDKIKNLRGYIEKINGIRISGQSKSLINSSVMPKGSIFYDIVNCDTSKGNGIVEFCKHLNIPISDTIGIGDDHNDISMFEVTGHSVAMGNSEDRIKKMVDEVIKSNNEEGLAQYLENLSSNL